jgi:pyrroloquinoline-quinone synthase
MSELSDSTLARIDEVIGASDPASDPLLSAMSSGRLSRDELRAFASQYFHLVDALPRFVSTVHSVTLDAHTRRSLLNVLVPLELAPPSISDLWLQTCAALGLFCDTVRGGQPTASTAACLSDYEYLCGEGSVQGVAALYAWMSRLPVVCRLEQAALAEHYELTAGPGVQFFEVIGFQASSHARALRTALAAQIERSPESADHAFYAAQSAVRAVQGLYFGALSPVG